MKTQKSLLIVGIFAAFAIIVTSCGDGGKAAKEKATNSTRSHQVGHGPRHRPRHSIVGVDSQKKGKYG